MVSILAVHPWSHVPLNEFLATFGRANLAAWTAQIVWYLAAVAMAGLAFWPTGRSSQLIGFLAAAYFAWIGVGYFVWLAPGIGLSSAWAAVFTLQAVLLLVAGVARSDLVIRPRRDLASGLGGVFIAYALIGYPVIGLLGGHPLRDLPVFGLAPCASVTFFFGLLVPLARALTAVPPDMATGVAADYGMLVVALIATGLIIWRDRAWTPTWETVAAGLLLALMIAWSGHDNILIGLAVVLVAAALVEAITGCLRQPQERTTPPHGTGKLKVS